MHVCNPRIVRRRQEDEETGKNVTSQNLNQGQMKKNRREETVYDPAPFLSSTICMETHPVKTGPGYCVVQQFYRICSEELPWWDPPGVWVKLLSARGTSVLQYTSMNFIFQWRFWCLSLFEESLLTRSLRSLIQWAVDVSVLRSIYHFCRGLEFVSQHPCWRLRATCNSRDMMPSFGLKGHLHSCAHSHILKKIFKQPPLFFFF